MQEQTSAKDLNDRLALIETMIAEGRRSTESWGWAFLLWGVAYYVAIEWASWGQHASIWGHSQVAWPVTMIVAFVLTMIIGFRKGRAQPGTIVGRAITSVWVSVGISMLLLFPALSSSGRIDQHSFVASVAAMLGAANAASGMILKWKMQIACAVAWWAVSVAACFGSDAQVMGLFLVGIFFCQIIFGIYVMISEAQRNKKNAGAHA